jgi:hypothetical protein
MYVQYQRTEALGRSTSGSFGMMAGEWDAAANRKAFGFHTSRKLHEPDKRRFCFLVCNQYLTSLPARAARRGSIGSQTAILAYA